MANRESLLERNAAYRKANPVAIRERKRAARLQCRQVTASVAVRAGTPWSPEEDDLLLSSSMRRVELAVVLGRSLSSVESRLDRINNRGRVLAADREQQRRSREANREALNKKKRAQWAANREALNARRRETSNA